MIQPRLLPTQDWMSAPSTTAVVNCLEADGLSVKFVGGCIRDSLTGRPVTDIDIATPEKPEKVIKLLNLSKIKTVPSGLKHGTVTAIVDNSHFQITTLRRDVKTDGRHAKIAFTLDWLEDAKRRDLTINAIYASPSGILYDPFDGISDLKQGRVRFIGLAGDRIAEDYLRILRFFRFHGQFARGSVDEEAKLACRIGAPRLQDLSGERIRDEFFKILLAPNPSKTCAEMQDAQVLQHILPKNFNINRLRVLCRLETEIVKIDKVEPDAIRYLAALLGTNQTKLIDFTKRLKLSKKQGEQFTYLVNPKKNIDITLDEVAIKRAIRKLGGGRMRDLVLLSWTNELLRETKLPQLRRKAYIQILAQSTKFSPPPFPISGADVLAMGERPGPGVGDLLSHVETWWESNGYKANHQDCINELKRIIEKTRKNEA